MRAILLALALSSASLQALAQGQHACAADAAKKGLALLRLHSDADDRASTDERSVRKIATVKALRGKGAFDVLEVEGSVYKASYRLRMIYAQMPGSCLLMGQEILERSDPY